MPKLVSSVWRFTLILLLLAQIVRVGVMAWINNPMFEFDQSNTLMIAKSDPTVIFRVLAQEQNFPLYYLMLHALFRLGLLVEVVKMTNVVIWLVGVGVFYFVLRLFGLRKTWALNGVFIYAYSCGFWTYGIALRMYALQLLCVLLTMAAALKFVSDQAAGSRKLMLISSALVSLLHPFGVFILVWWFGLWRERKVSTQMFGKVAVMTLGIAIGLLIMKTNVGRIFSTGAEYMRLGPGTNWYLPARMLNGYSEFLGWIVAGVAWASLIWWWGRGKSRPGYGLAGACGLVMLAVFAAGDALQINIQWRHVIVLAPMLLVVMVKCLAWQGPRVRLAGMVTLMLGAGLMTSVVTLAHDSELHQSQARCKEMAEIRRGTVVTTFHEHFLLVYCRAKYDREYWLTPDNLVKVNNLNRTEILILQAYYGGTPPVGKTAKSEDGGYAYPDDFRPDEVYVVTKTDDPIFQLYLAPLANKYGSIMRLTQGMYKLN